MNTEDNSQRNVTDKWLDSVYASVEKIGLCQRRAFDGCIDLREFIINLAQTQNMDLIKYQNAKIMITEIDLLLDNIMPIIPKTEYNSMKAYNKFLKDLSENRIEKYKTFVHHRSEDSRTQTFEVLEEFSYLIKYLSDLRERIISNLQGILFLEGNIKKNQVQKPQGEKPDV